MLTYPGLSSVAGERGRRDVALAGDVGLRGVVRQGTVHQQGLRGSVHGERYGGAGDRPPGYGGASTSIGGRVQGRGDAVHGDGRDGRAGREDLRDGHGRASTAAAGTDTAESAPALGPDSGIDGVELQREGAVDGHRNEPVQRIAVRVRGSLVGVSGLHLHGLGHLIAGELVGIGVGQVDVAVRDRDHVQVGEVRVGVAVSGRRICAASTAHDGGGRGHDGAAELPQAFGPRARRPVDAGFRIGSHHSAVYSSGRTSMKSASLMSSRICCTSPVISSFTPDGCAASS